MERPAWALRSVDISVPSVARMYDFCLGGAHNFEADRQAAREALRVLPALPKIIRANRAFQRRAIRFAAGEGVTQFLDIGCGIPLPGGVHEGVRAVCTRGRVVYVDHDPVAVALGRAVLDGDDDADVVAADLLRTGDVLGAPRVRRLIDFDRPVAVLLGAVLHFVRDDDDPWGAVAALTAALAPGSLLVLSHASDEDRASYESDASYESHESSYEAHASDDSHASDDVGSERTAGVCDETRNPIIMRSREKIARFFEGYDMVEPGLVPMPLWRPETPPEDEDPYTFCGLAGVGRTA